MMAAPSTPSTPSTSTAPPPPPPHAPPQDSIVDLPRIQEAHTTISPYTHRTPVLTCQAMDERLNLGGRDTHKRHLFFKCELYQKTGSFKVRGALNAVAHLDPSVTDVVTHSSGNHAQALAWAAKTKGLRAHIVMPKTAPLIKIKAVQGYGGKVYLCEPTVEARKSMAAELVASTGGALVHPSDDYDVIAGQGTAAIEFIEQVKAEHGVDLDAIIIPVGGGGLLGGMAVAAKALLPGCVVIGAEPAMVDDAARSKKMGKLCLHPTPAPRSIADGLLTVLGEKTFQIIASEVVDAIVTVSEKEIAQAMHLIYERMKVVIEPSAGVGVAVALSGEKRLGAVLPAHAKNIGVVLCGGNLDVGKLEAIWRLAEEGEDNGGGGGGEGEVVVINGVMR